MRSHRSFVLFFVIVAVLRTWILLTSQTHVNNDEAIVGLMAKHILQGRFFPFYMYGQQYNAGAAWEAYLAAISFALFGVGVMPLKAVIMSISLLCLVVVYVLADNLYGRQTALLAAIAFGMCPSLLKWHFQARGYSWYFLSLPLLTLMFWRLVRTRQRQPRLVFWFGVACGASVWDLELALPPALALWALLVCRGHLDKGTACLGLGGWLIGYGPALAYNVAHNGGNWRLFASKASAGDSAMPATLSDVLAREMPKCFGTDTVFWYYPETSAWGWVFYALAVAAVAAAAWPLARFPARLLRGAAPWDDADKDGLMLVLVGACFLPYLLIGPPRVPFHFLGACCFLALLSGRLVARCPRWLGGLLLLVMVVGGLLAMAEVQRHSQIETLVMGADGHGRTARLAASDLETMQGYLRQHGVTSVWATMPFVYPLLFETGEKIAVSDPIGHWEQAVYPREVAMPAGGAAPTRMFVIETDSPFRAQVEKSFAQSGDPWFSARFGAITVVVGGS